MKFEGSKFLMSVFVLMIALGFSIDSHGYEWFGINKKLIHAIQERDYKKTEDLLKSGANPNYLKLTRHRNAGQPYYSMENQTPLILAIQQRDLNIVNLLLKKGANPNFFARQLKGKYRITGEANIYPLGAAVGQNDQKIVESLLRAGASINGTSSSLGDTPSPLTLTLSKGFLSMAEYLVSQGADPNYSGRSSRTDTRNDTPLEAAIMYFLGSGDEAPLNWILAKGANPHYVDSWGNTPMHYTLSFGPSERMARAYEILRSSPYNASADIVDSRNKSYLYIILEQLYAANVDLTFSQRHVMFFKRLLLEDHLNPNLGKPLMQAIAEKFGQNAYRGSEPMDILIDQIGISAEEAVGWMTMGNQGGVIEYLVNYKHADVNAIWHDYTPLMRAASNNNASMIKFLILHGACFRTESNGRTAISFAPRNSEAENLLLWELTHQPNHC